MRSSGACLRMRASHDSFVSSIAAHNSPRGRAPARVNASSGTRVSRLPIPSRPRASASRLAGSIVNTRTLPPWRHAAMAAAAAAVVVLPTPPGPQATTISREASNPSSEPPCVFGGVCPCPFAWPVAARVLCSGASGEGLREPSERAIRIRAPLRVSARSGGWSASRSRG